MEQQLMDVITELWTAHKNTLALLGDIAEAARYEGDPAGLVECVAAMRQDSDTIDERSEELAEFAAFAARLAIAAGFDAVKVAGDPDERDRLVDHVRLWANNGGADCSVADELTEEAQRLGMYDTPGDTFLGWSYDVVDFDDGYAAWDPSVGWAWWPSVPNSTIGDGRWPDARVYNAFDVVPERHHKGLRRALAGLPGLPDSLDESLGCHACNRRKE
jgi:hypothetical protein